MKTRKFTLIELIIVLVVICMVACIVVGAGLLVKGCDSVRKNGLKPVAEKIWNGPKDINVPKINE